MERLTHINENGQANMVDISEKTITIRRAVASGSIRVNEDVLKQISDGTNPKGDILSVARIAGIMAAKKTPDLIPLCHTLLLDNVSIDFDIDHDNNLINAVCTVVLSGKTGAEMEALTGVSTALLTIYDMCKAADKDMVISDIRLEEKSGGKSGHYVRI